MKIRLFFDVPLSTNQIVLLNKAQSHYLHKVLRCQIGDEFFLFNNRDGEFLARINSLGSSAEVVILQNNRSVTVPKNITLAFAPAKNVKAEFVALKATELNVRNIRPVISERTIVRKINEEKLRANMVEAAEQCDSVFLPSLLSTLTLPKFLKQLTENDVLIFCDESRKGKRAPELFSELQYQDNKNYIILTGPEGGFAESERELINNFANCYNLSLGNNVLRVDTAIIAALALFNNFYDN